LGNLTDKPYFFSLWCSNHIEKLIITNIRKPATAINVVMNIYEYETVTLFHLSVHASSGEFDCTDEPDTKSIKEKSIKGYFAHKSIVLYASPVGSFEIFITPFLIAVRIEFIEV
jgi:hypothetical protein